MGTGILQISPSDVISNDLIIAEHQTLSEPRNTLTPK